MILSLFGVMNCLRNMFGEVVVKVKMVVFCLYIMVVVDDNMVFWWMDFGYVFVRLMGDLVFWYFLKLGEFEFVVM